MTQDFQQYLDCFDGLESLIDDSKQVSAHFYILGVYFRNRLEAHLWTLHAAVTGEKIAAETLRDAVSLVLAHELARVKLKHILILYFTSSC